MARKIRPMDEVGTEGRAAPPPPPPPGMPPPPGGEIPVGYPAYTQAPQPPAKDHTRIAMILLLIAGIMILISAYSMLMVDPSDYGSDISSSLGMYGADDETVVLNGTVTDSAGEPIEGARVLVSGEDLWVYTDAGGSYTLEDVPVGGQTVTVTKDNYTTIEHKIFIDSEALGGSSVDEIELSFTMTEGTGVKRTGSYESEFFDLMGSVLRICGALLIIGAVMVFLSAALCYLRRKYVLAMVGSIFGIIFGISLFIGTILSIIAIYLIYRSKHAFK